MDDEVRAWYAARAGKRLELSILATALGTTPAYVCRRARSLGLTNQRRLSGRKVRVPKHATKEARLASIGRATRERIAAKGHPRGARGLKRTPEHTSKLQSAAARWQRETPPAIKDAVNQKQLATKLKKYGTLSPGFRGTSAYSRCKHGRREDLGGQFFRSSWEANYARFLNLLIRQGQVAVWEFETDTFWFEKIRRGVRSYTPDFKITEPSGAIYYVEVKGWMDSKSKTKLKRMKKYHPTVDLRLVDAKAYKEIEKKLAGAIPGWERAA